MLNNFENGDTKAFIEWKDTDGNIINVHSGGIIYTEGKYWWYGMDKRDSPATKGRKGGQKTKLGVRMYSSVDLYNWKDEGIILNCTKRGPCKGPMRFERPKILYNDKTKKYVMWWHHVSYPGNHKSKKGFAEAGTASCDTINGKYTFHGLHRPVDDGDVKDCTLFKDSDGKAYFIYDKRMNSEDRRLTFVELSEDYLHSTSNWYSFPVEWSKREAPAIFEHNGFYYLFTSGLTGWHPNQCIYYRAENIHGPWMNMGDPCSGKDAEITYNSQSTYVFKVEGMDDAFIFMADRWNDENSMIKSSHIWLPVIFTSDTTVKLDYFKKWDLNFFKNEPL